MDIKRVLIIDDDAELCEELQEILGDEGYDVEATTDSVKGAGLIDKDNYDIAILDFKMPHLTAVDILKQVKIRGRKTKFLLISGRPFIEKTLKEEGLSELVSGIINKPFNADVLLEKIKNSCQDKK